jgi:pyruvate,water dikinase
MAAREEFRSSAMRSFLSIRRDLVRLARDADVAVDDLWLLEADEVRRLDEGVRPRPELLAERRAEQERRRSHPIPEVVRRFDPPSDTSSDEDPEHPDELHGLGLVAASAEGLAWVLTEPAHELPEGLEPTSTILVAPSVDPGWLATFGLVAGVAVELGGDLSHGSIVLRELGLPAVTNVRGLTAVVRTGDRLALDGRHGRVRIAR